MFRADQWVRVRATGERGQIKLRRNAMLDVKHDDINGWRNASLVDRGPHFLIDQMGRYAVEMDRVGRGWVFYAEHELEDASPADRTMLEKSSGRW